MKRIAIRDHQNKSRGLIEALQDNYEIVQIGDFARSLCQLRNMPKKSEPITDGQVRKLAYEMTRHGVNGGPNAMDEIRKLDKWTASNVIKDLVDGNLDYAMGQLKHLDIKYAGS